MRAKLFSFLSFLILLIGCSKAPYLPYHSTAEIPRQTYESSTVMRQVKLDGIDTKYAVIAAVDRDSLGYLLFAPLKSPNAQNYDFWDYDITFSTSIPPEDVADIIKALDLILKKWDNLQSRTDGFFYEYSQTLEQDLTQVSKNVVERKPAVHIYFNLTEKGSAGSLIVGEGDLKHIYSFKEKRQVEIFRKLLSKGKDLINDMLKS